MRFLIFLLIIAVVPIISCSKDCNPPRFDNNIVGNWNGYAEINGTTKQGGTATFNGNGTGTSPGEIFQASFNGGDKIKDFVWALDTIDNRLGLTYDDNGNIFSVHYPIKSNECKTIKLEFIGGTIILNRN